MFTNSHDIYCNIFSSVLLCLMSCTWTSTKFRYAGPFQRSKIVPKLNNGIDLKQGNLDLVF